MHYAENYYKKKEKLTEPRKTIENKVKKRQIFNPKTEICLTVNTAILLDIYVPVGFCVAFLTVCSSPGNCAITIASAFLVPFSTVNKRIFYLD